MYIKKKGVISSRGCIYIYIYTLLWILNVMRVYVLCVYSFLNVKYLMKWLFPHKHFCYYCCCYIPNPQFHSFSSFFCIQIVCMLSRAFVWEEKSQQNRRNKKDTAFLHFMMYINTQVSMPCHENPSFFVSNCRRMAMAEKQS